MIEFGQLNAQRETPTEVMVHLDLLWGLWCGSGRLCRGPGSEGREVRNLSGIYKIVLTRKEY